jgi:serine phosphatase RsbU (regulator of sigma subunit)
MRFKGRIAVMNEIDPGQEDLISIAGFQAMDDHLASMRYAGMIQHALLPDRELLDKILKNYFVLFLPKDIVSGDFYYVSFNRDIMCIALGDCTGHGVPGALMSILGISFLNEVLQSKTGMKANRILNIMREKVMKALHQTGDRSPTKDSIDLALSLIDCNNNSMQFAGANRPLVRIRDGVLTEFRPDLMTIGLAPLKECAFTNHAIDTRPGDMFYLFSDGFPDQFGGLYNKKLKNRNFKKLLESVSNLPLREQKDRLEKYFFEWKGEESQVDDVLVFGFKL